MKRRLSAIVSADVVGFSRMVEADEMRTLTAVAGVFRNVVEPAVKRHGGRVVKTAGDSALMEFESAVEAVRSAVEIQAGVQRSGAPIPIERRVQIRIGINVADVVVEGDDIFGDGVNIAARLQSLAEAGGILLSDRVREDIEGKIELPLIDLGERRLHNIMRPLRAWAVVDDAPAPPVQPQLTLPARPSIAVLPFDNLGHNPSDDAFVDGICEDVTTELSRFSSLFVIARNSAFTYKSRAVDVRQVARELGVRYVLEGSVRMSGKRARINAQLIDALSGGHLWAERYDSVVEDVFDVQEDITRRIVAAVAPEVEAAEVAILRRARPANFTAHERALRAWADASQAYVRGDSRLRDHAIAQAEEALRLDASCGRALSTLAFAYWQHANFRTGLPPEESIARAIEAGSRALELDRGNYMARVYRGAALWIAQKFDEALEDMRDAWQQNPNDVSTLIALGWAEVASGDTTNGTRRLREALRISPRDPQQYNAYTCLCAGAFVDADYAHGVEWGNLGKRQQPGYAPIIHYLALNYAGLGDMTHAAAEIAQLRRIAPEWLEQRLAGFSALVRPADRARSLDLLRKAADHAA
jgi:adenylate cyclase